MLSEESLALVRELFRGRGAGQRGAPASARILLDWQVESQASRDLAALDEREIAWESEAIGRVADGRGIPYQRASIELANSTDRGERLTLDARPRRS